MFEAKLESPRLARSCAVLGVLLCVDELLMLHECLDQRGPVHLFLGLEFMSAIAIGVTMLRLRIFNRVQVGMVVVIGVLTSAAYGLEFIGVNQDYVRLEEGFEVACALLGLGLAVLAPGRLNHQRLAVRGIFWGTLGVAAGVLVLIARPHVCSTVDHWSKKYFHEQIW